jgi:asparagine synthase (glutamine-hydrolysing)
LRRHLEWSRILSPEAEDIFTEPSAVAECLARTAAAARASTEHQADGGPLNAVLAFDLQYSLPADMLQKVDLASMMHSLEVRVPFLDPQVVELALSFPSSWKIDRGRRKRVLIDAYRGLLPDEILDRPKQGFEVPIGEYLRGPLQPMFRDVVTRSNLERFGIVDHNRVESLLQQHASGDQDHADLLWSLLSLCWWEDSRRR